MDADTVERVRAWLVEHGGDPTPTAIRRAFDATGVVVESAALDQCVARVRAELVGAGVLQPLLDTPGVTDVLVNGHNQIWVDQGAGLRSTGLSLGSESAARALAQRMAAQAGRRLDDATPFVDARLPDGVRLHAAIPPLASPGTLISLRVPARTTFDMAAVVRSGSISEAGAAWLRAVIAARCGFLVTGATGSGKTTVLRAMLGLVSPADRIVAIEESAELEVPHPHFVRLEARMANAESRGAVAMTDLMRQAMRMRPDRIVVGEVRGAEVTALLNAMNTGHEGSCGTVHANDPTSLPARIEALGLAAGMDRAAVHSQLAAGLDLVLHVARSDSGRRRVAQIGVIEAGESTGLVRVVPLLTFTDAKPRLHRAGHPVARRLLSAISGTRPERYALPVA